MNDLIYLFSAFTLIWIGTFGYLVRLVGLRKQLEVKIEDLERRIVDMGSEDV